MRADARQETQMEEEVGEGEKRQRFRAPCTVWHVALHQEGPLAVGPSLKNFTCRHPWLRAKTNFLKVPRVRFQSSMTRVELDVSVPHTAAQVGEEA